jgi:arsenite oxidase small subunit
MEKSNRRIFLKSSAASGAAVFSGIYAKESEARDAVAKREYPIFRIAAAEKISVGASSSFFYPDGDSPCLLIKTGRPAAGGVGPQRDIVAYSALCSHMGCPVRYDASSQTIKCPCHYSIFDPEKNGQMVCGQATENLPQIRLSFDERSGSVHAVGVSGLLYGRVSNLL